MQGYVRTYLAELGGDHWPLRVRSPGRINIIGEHVDYTGGLVMPASIDRGIDFAVRKLDHPHWQLHAIDLGQTYTLPLPLTGRTGELWVDYLAGVGIQFQDQGQFLPGLEIVFGGNLPRGSGMSSSAALEGGMAFILNELLNSKMSRPELAQLCMRSSNTFLGIPSGIMDQYASLNGSASGPLVLNCHTLESEPVKDALDDYSFVLVNSMVAHDLSDGAYAQRVAACNQALQAVRKRFPRVDHLSATTAEQLNTVADSLDPVVLKRARYVVAENERVRQAITAIEAGSSYELGQLLNATHEGLRNEYEVSCPELDFLQAQANELGGAVPTRYGTSLHVAGARLMGGGFGGCTINLVRTEGIDEFQRKLATSYQRQYEIEAEFYPVNLSAGTHLL